MIHHKVGHGHCTRPLTCLAGRVLYRRQAHENSVEAAAPQCLFTRPACTSSEELCTALQG